MMRNLRPHEAKCDLKRSALDGHMLIDLFLLGSYFSYFFVQLPDRGLYVTYMVVICDVLSIFLSVN